MPLAPQAQRVTMHPDEMSSEARRSVTAVGEVEKGISTYEEAFQHIREATGVTDAQVRSPGTDPAHTYVRHERRALRQRENEHSKCQRLAR